MLDDRICTAGGAHNYHETMAAVRRFDEGLANFVERVIPHDQWHAMVHETMFEKRDLYERLVSVIDNMQANVREMVVGGEMKPTLHEAWDVANEIFASYRCDVGFTDKPQVFTVLVTLKQPQIITGLPPAILKASNEVARSFETRRKWTFGFDNRQFIMDLGPDAIRELRDHPFVEKVEYSELPDAHIMGTPEPPYNPATENTDWGVERILTAVPWGLTPPRLGHNVKVCVIDTGVDYTHQAYWKDGVCVYKGGFNFVGSNDDPRDDQDHGCLEPDGVVYTSEGAFRIEELWRRYSLRPDAVGDAEADVGDCGLRVMSLDPEEPGMVEGRILKIFQIAVDCEVVKIKTVSGMELTLTPWHPTYVWDGKHIVERRADEITETDFLITPGVSVARLGGETFVAGLLLDERAAYELGLMLSKNHCDAWTPDMVLETVGGATESVIASFICGFIDGTGHCSWRAARLTLATTNVPMGSALSYLMSLIGLEVNFVDRGSMCSIYASGIFNYRKLMKLCVDKIENYALLRRIRDFSNLNDGDDKSLSGYWKTMFDRFHLDYVASIEREPFKGHFYDLQVDGHHNYLAGRNRPTFIHNTWCSGIIAEQHNGNGYKGIAPDISLYACKVLDSKGSGSFNNVAAGIDWARTNGCHIISLSLGGSSSVAVLKTACDAAWYAGLLVCASAGNSGPEDNTVGFPAAYQSAIAVAAIDSNELVATFSSRGPEVEIAAPGVNITGPWAGFTYSDYATSDQLYMCANGTSPACPHVAGAAAIIKSWYPFISNIDLRMWLRDHARDL